MVVILCLFVVIGILVEEPQAGYYTTSYAIRDANDRIDALEVRVKWLEKEIKTLRQNTRFKTILFEEGG
jgi:cell division protein FtsL